MMVVFVDRDLLEPYHVVHIRHSQIEMILQYVFFLPFATDISSSSWLHYQIDFHCLLFLCRKIQSNYFSFCHSTLNIFMRGLNSGFLESKKWSPKNDIIEGLFDCLPFDCSCVRFVWRFAFLHSLSTEFWPTLGHFVAFNFFTFFYFIFVRRKIQLHLRSMID